MRDPKRIDVLLKEIETIWKANPDLRLMQLLLNCTGITRMSGHPVLHQPSDQTIKHQYPHGTIIIDHYNTEDAVVLDCLKSVYGTRDEG